MLTLQKAVGQLRLVVKTACEQSVKFSQLSRAGTSICNSDKCSAPTQTLNGVCAQGFSTNCVLRKKESTVKMKKSYAPQSPYRNPGPRRYGYNAGYFTGGLLPRIDNDQPIQSMPTYKPKDSWDKKHALYGQNDYIDILGDGRLTPVDMINGPPWLIGFRGNELQRLARRLKFQGEKLAHWYPAKYHSIKKRVWFLYKKYNKHRGRRTAGQ